MIKRLSGAVLYALMGFAGAAGGPMTPLDTSDDDVVECHSSQGASSTNRAAGLLGRASSACGELIEDAWIARSPDGQTLVVTLHKDGPYAAQLLLATHPASPTDSPLAAGLIGRAMHLAHERGLLKITLVARRIDPPHVQAIANRCGFRLTRLRHIDNARTAEFYADLYWTGQQSDEHTPIATA